MSGRNAASPPDSQTAAPILVVRGEMAGGRLPVSSLAFVAFMFVLALALGLLACLFALTLVALMFLFALTFVALSPLPISLHVRLQRSTTETSQQL
jgi:uncharacterized membrane protein